MLSYNEVTPKKYIVYEGEPHEVLSSHVFRMQQRKPVNATKLRNLMSGKVIEHSFHVSDKAAEAELEKREVKYLYNKSSLPAGRQGEWWFCAPSDPSKRFQLPESVIGEGAKFLKTNAVVEQILFNDKIVSVRMPIKVELKVTEAPPDVRGNTAQGGSKIVTLETGAQLAVPMFIKVGDTLVINTETGEYVSRV